MGWLLRPMGALLGLIASKDRSSSQSRDPPLLKLGADFLTLHQLYEGVLAIGGTGSGKTSSLAHLMLALMEQGVGMLILTAKGTDYADVARLARMAGREMDLRRFAPGERWKFDFLNYELNRRRGGSVESGSQLFSDLVDVASRTQSSDSRDPFWTLAANRLIRMAMYLCWWTFDECSVSDLYVFISSLATSPDAMKTAEWSDGFAAKCRAAAWNTAGWMDDTDLHLAMQYCYDQFPRMGEKTSAGIVATALNAVSKFVHGDVQKLVADGSTNLSPDDVLAGRIVVIDMPALMYREPGQFVQLVWKLSTIRATLRRDLSANARPVCLWADEAQLHAIPSVDSMTQAVARSHRLINVAITQNLPLLYATLKSREDAISWVSNLQTKLIFSNSDAETNVYFSSLFGQSKQCLMNTSMDTTQPYSIVDDLFGIMPKASVTMSENWFPDVRPEEFTRLRKGGNDNRKLVDCFVFQGGRRFSGNGNRTWTKVTFKQMG